MRAAWLLLLLLLPACTQSPRSLDRDTRDAAALRGLRFLEQIANHPTHFTNYGHDLMWAFYTLSEASADPEFRQEARAFGKILARRWRDAHPVVPPNPTLNQVYNYIAGAETADDLGVIDDAMRHRLAAEAARFSPEEFLSFNPAIEPPPSDIPQPCARCQHRNPRGARTCQKCANALTMTDPYDIFFEALVTSYGGDHYGVRMGASFEQVARWIPYFHPYKQPTNSATYLITHIIYTLNDYDQYRLRPEWLPHEFAYLKQHAQSAIDQNDPETLGEFIDSLQVFGVPDHDPLVRRGIDYLLSKQNPDGSWGEINDPDIYTRYHTTWTGIGGVMRYAFRGHHLPQKPGTDTSVPTVSSNQNP